MLCSSRGYLVLLLIDHRLGEELFNSIKKLNWYKDACQSFIPRNSSLEPQLGVFKTRVPPLRHMLNSFFFFFPINQVSLHKLCEAFCVWISTWFEGKSNIKYWAFLSGFSFSLRLSSHYLGSFQMTSNGFFFFLSSFQVVFSTKVDLKQIHLPKLEAKSPQ